MLEEKENMRKAILLFSLLSLCSEELRFLTVLQMLMLLKTVRILTFLAISARNRI